MLPLRRHFQKIAVLLSCLMVAPCAHAIYKCTAQDGSTSYSDLPCNGEKLQLEHDRPSHAPNNEQQLARQQAELTRLQNLRELRERQDQQYHQMNLRGQAARQKKCRALALQKKWKEEDAASALLPAQIKARRAARRAGEKYQSECG